MIDITVRNFQSIEHVELCIDGFTALVGRSGLGKSALVRAVKAALTGAGGTAFVRHGPACAKRLKASKTCECFATVHLRTLGFDLEWKKGDKINQYAFNGQIYDRTEQGTPDFLVQPQLAQGFDTVDVARKAKLLQIADQFDNVFLLDQTGGTVADVLSDVARLDRINVALRMVEKERKEASSTRKVYEKEVSENTVKLAMYSGIDVVIQNVANVASYLGRIEASQVSIEKLSGYLEELQVLGYKVDELQRVCGVTTPVYAPLEERGQALTKLMGFCTSLGEKVRTVRALSGVENVVEPDISPVIENNARLLSLKSWVSRLQVFQELFGRVKPIEATVVPTLKPLIEAQEKFSKLESDTSRYNLLVKSVENLTRDYDLALVEEDAVNEELHALGVCPTCTQPVSTSLQMSATG